MRSSPGPASIGASSADRTRSAPSPASRVSRARLAVEGVVAARAAQHVVAHTAVQPVGSPPPPRAGRRPRRRPADRHPDPLASGVVAAGAGEVVAPRAALQHVRAGAAAQPVVAVAAVDGRGRPDDRHVSAPSPPRIVADATPEPDITSTSSPARSSALTAAAVATFMQSSRVEGASNRERFFKC